MFTLQATNTIQAVAGTGTAVTSTLFGLEVTATSRNFKLLDQRQLPTSAAAIYTVPASTQTIVKSWILKNTTASDVAVTLYINGTAAGNTIDSVTVLANAKTVLDDKGVWSIYNSTGVVVTTIGGAAGGDLSGSYPNPTLNNSAVTNAKMANMNNNTIKGNVSGGAAAPSDLTGTQATTILDPATFSLKGLESAAEHIALNSMDGRTSTGTNPRVFRPGDYMVGNTYDPTGSANSTTAFQAMMTAIAAWNDRCCIQLTPGVFKLDPGVIKNFGTNNTSFSIIGPGRGLCILLPTGAGDMITFNRNTTGGDSITVRGFTIYNTSGTPYTSGNGILTNGADAIDISEVAFIDLFNDIQVSGQPYTMTTNGTTSVTGISPAVSAADNGETVSGPGIVPGTTFTFVSSSSGTLSVAATVSTTATRFLDTSIKVSIQKMVSFNTNGNGSGCGIVLNNGQAGDTYMGPDIVMSDGGGTTRRRACIEIVESGHYEITQANLTGSQRGILIDPGASQSVGFGFHTNVLCDSNTVNGMLVDTLATTATIKNIKSVNSWYSGTTVVNGSAAAAGVKTQMTAAGTINGFTFTTDRFLNNRTHGFEHAAAGATDFRWSDCDMKGNSSVGSAQADGLNVAANIGNWSINGGKYGGTDTVPTAGNQRYGINVAAGTGNNIKISPDDLTGNVTGPLSFGATGVSNFINGCPGLAAPYARGASSAAITTVITVGNLFIPKNSVRVGTTFRLTARGQHSGAATAPTFTCRIGNTNDAVGSAATNGIIVSAVDATAATSQWFGVEFYLTFTAIGGSGNIQGSGIGVTSIAAGSAGRAWGTALAARASTAGFVAVDTTADKYLTLAFVCGVAGATIHNTSIDVVNY